MPSLAPPGLLARWALPTEAHALYPLLASRASALGEDPPHPTAFTATLQRSFLPDARYRFLVAQESGRVVGCASLHSGMSTWRGLPVVEMQDEVVAPDARAPDDVLREMVAFAERHARAIGACRLEARAAAGEDARWRALGLATAPYVLVRKDLRPPEADSPF